MSQDIQVSSQTLSLNATVQDDKKKSSKALAASLARLEEVLEIVAEVESSGKGHSSKASVEGVISEVMAVLKKRPGAFKEVVQVVANHTIEGSKEFTSEAHKALNKYLSENGAFFDHLESIVRRVGAVKSGNPEDSKDLNQTMADAMMFLQIFQSAIDHSQAENDKNTAKMADNLVAVTVKAQKDTINKIKEEVAAYEKALHSKPWWSVFVEVVVAVVAVAVTFLTAGAGAAVVAACVVAFMDSPAATALSGDVAKAVGGGSIGKLIGTIVVTAVIMVCTCGLGSITIAADSATTEATEAAADEATEAGVDSASGAAEGSIDDVESEVSEAENEESVVSRVKPGKKSLINRLGYNLKNGTKLALIQALPNFIGAGGVMNTMNAIDSTWVENNEWAAMGIDIGASLIGMGASGYVGLKSLAGTGESLLDSVPRALKIIYPVDCLCQMGAGAMGVYSGVKTYGYLNDQATNMEEIGADEAIIAAANMGVTTAQDISGTTDSNASNINNSIASELSSLCKAAGSTWREASSDIRG